MWRLLLGAGAALASYYLGREVGRTEPLRREQAERSARRSGASSPAPSEASVEEPPPSEPRRSVH